MIDFPAINTVFDVFRFYLEVFDYRLKNKEKSRELAHWAFDHASPYNTSFDWSDNLQKLRYELGALEATGAFDDPELNQKYSSQEEYDNFLWQRFKNLVIDNLKAQKSI